MKKYGAGRVLKAQTVDLEKQFFILFYYYIVLLYYFIVFFERDEAVGYINVKCY